MSEKKKKSTDTQKLKLIIQVLAMAHYVRDIGGGKIRFECAEKED